MHPFDCLEIPPDIFSAGGYNGLEPTKNHTSSRILPNGKSGAP